MLETSQVFFLDEEFCRFGDDKSLRAPRPELPILVWCVSVSGIQGRHRWEPVQLQILEC